MNEEQKKFLDVIKRRKKRLNRLAHPNRKRKLEVQVEEEVKNNRKINQFVDEVINEKQIGWYWLIPLILVILFAIYLLLRI